MSPALLAAFSLESLNFLRLSTFTTVEVGVRYFLFAGIAWLLAYVLFPRRWFHRKIIARLP